MSWAMNSRPARTEAARTEAARAEPLPAAADPGAVSPGTPRAAPGRLTVVVNGEPRSTRATTLAALLVETGYGSARIATARNGDFVAERVRAQTPLVEGDQIEIVAPRQGG